MANDSSEGLNMVRTDDPSPDSIPSSPLAIYIVALIIALLPLSAPGLHAQAEFVRGDINADGQLSIADATMWFCVNFSDFWPVSCADVADVDDNGSVDLGDLALTWSFLFGPSDPASTIPAPVPGPGLDPTEDGLGCESQEVIAVIEGDDRLSLDSVGGAPGKLVRVPLRLTTSVVTGGLQVAVRFDRTLFTPVDLTALEEIERLELIKGGTVLDDDRGTRSLSFIDQRSTDDQDVLWVGYLYGLLPPEVVGPGEDLHVLNIPGYVSPDARAGDVIPLELVELVEMDGLTMHSEVAAGWRARRVIDLGEGSITVAEAFVRGDGNVDGRIDLSDAIHTLRTLFVGDAVIDCLDAADFDDDSSVDVSDANLDSRPPFSRRPRTSRSLSRVRCGSERRLARLRVLSALRLRRSPRAGRTAAGGARVASGFRRAGP